MALQHIFSDGTLKWTCLHCQEPCSVHISHERVAWDPENPGFVQLPYCPKCGARMTVKVIYSEEEMQTDNMIQYGMVPEPHTLPHALTGEPIPVLIPALKPIGANPSIARHQELARQLLASGKHPPS